MGACGMVARVVLGGGGGGELWANDDGDGEVKQRLNLMVTHQSAPF